MGQTMIGKWQIKTRDKSNVDYPVERASEEQSGGVADSALLTVDL